MREDLEVRGIHCGKPKSYKFKLSKKLFVHLLSFLWFYNQEWCFVSFANTSILNIIGIDR